MRALIYLTLLLAVSAPSSAYLYDCGPANLAGAIVKLGTSTEWVAQPFSVSRDAYATQFGAALGRAYGPAGAGFTVELTTWSENQPGPVIESWTVVPTLVSLTYYYFDPVAPIALNGIGSGAYYALVFRPDTEGFAGSISYTAKPGCYYGKAWNGASGWSTMLAPLVIRVDGYYVPEPGCMGMLAAGLLVFALRRRC